MTSVPVVADPADAAAVCALLDTLGPEELHALAAAVAAMTRDLAATRRRVAELEARDRQRGRRIALQHATIIQLQRREGADPHEILAAIDKALGDAPTGPPAGKAKPEPLPVGTVLGAVRVERARLTPLPLSTTTVSLVCPEEDPPGTQEPDRRDTTAPSPVRGDSWCGRLIRRGGR